MMRRAINCIWHDSGCRTVVAWQPSNFQDIGSTLTLSYQGFQADTLIVWFLILRKIIKQVLQLAKVFEEFFNYSGYRLFLCLFSVTKICKYSVTKVQRKTNLVIGIEADLDHVVDASLAPFWILPSPEHIFLLRLFHRLRFLFIFF